MIQLDSRRVCPPQAVNRTIQTTEALANQRRAEAEAALRARKDVEEAEHRARQVEVERAAKADEERTRLSLERAAAEAEAAAKRKAAQAATKPTNPAQLDWQHWHDYMQVGHLLFCIFVCAMPPVD